jgi:hypothetical protein
VVVQAPVMAQAQVRRPQRTRPRAARSTTPLTNQNFFSNKVLDNHQIRAPPSAMPDETPPQSGKNGVPNDGAARSLATASAPDHDLDSFPRGSM